MNTKQTEIGEIPADWEVVKLGDVAEIKSGGTPSTSNKDFWDGEIAWCTPTDITALKGGKYLTQTSRNITKSGLQYSAAELLPADSIVMTSRATIGECAIAKIPVTTNQGFKNFICFDKVDSEFIYYLLGTQKKRFVALCAGSTFLEININQVRSFQVAIPKSKPEQNAIAAILSDTDRLLAALRALIGKKRAVKTAAMQQLLSGRLRLPGFAATDRLKNSELGEIPEDWEVVKLGEVARIKTGSKNNQDKADNGLYPFFVRSETVERINTFSYACEAILVPGEGGIGKIFHYINGKFDAHQRVYVIREFQNTVAKFVYFAMVHSFGAYAMENSVKATVDSLRLPTFKNFQFAAPKSNSEQTAIAQTLSDMDSEIAALEARAAKLAQIKQGLMQNLLTGKIRVNTGAA